MDIVKPVQDAMSAFLSYLPQLAGALVILLIGLIVAKLVGAAISGILGRVGFDRLMSRAGVNAFLQRTGTSLTPSKVFGKVLFWFIFVITFTMFASALGVPQVSGFLNRMIGYIPRVFAAIAILFLAAVVANFLAALIRGATGNDVFARIGRYAVVVYAVFAALTQLGIAVQLTANTLLIALAGAALAVGIAFGWGGRDVARGLLNRAFDSHQVTTDGADAATAPRQPDPSNSTHRPGI